LQDNIKMGLMGVDLINLVHDGTQLRACNQNNKFPCSIWGWEYLD